MILLIKLIILKSYFVERDRNIRAIQELCIKLPDWNLVGKYVMKHIWKRLTSWSHPFGPHIWSSTPSDAVDTLTNAVGSIKNS